MTDDVKMMTYVEAAGVLGIKIDSVKRRARNRGWKRIKGNDGLVRIGVPVEILALSERDNPPDPPSDRSEDIVRLEKQVSVLETEVRMLREREHDLKQDRDAWKSQAEPWRWWPFR